jgi:CRP/FNR family transcriptional regulator, anaerobic regulatory protein
VFTPSFHIDQESGDYSKGLLTALEKIGVPRHVEKSSCVMAPDTLFDFFFYIRSGIFKTVCELNERQVILGFTFPGDVDGDPASLIGQSKTNFSIVAVSDSNILMCRWKDLEQELSREKYLSTIKFFLARYTAILQNRVVESLAVTAEARYKRLVLQQPDHLNEIPISDLASYLGITRQSLSRIRNARW